MQLKVVLCRAILIDGDLHEVTVEASEFAARWEDLTARTHDMHRQLNVALEAIEADLREPQPRPALHLAGQGSRT